MTERDRRLVDRIVGSDYLEGLAEKSLEDLRSMREECRQGENELSFERRRYQARIDILSAELQRRTGGADTGSLVDRLPEILASGRENRQDLPIPQRAPDLSMPRSADVPRRRVEEIAGERTLSRLSQMSSEEITSTIASLAEHEKTLSARRMKAHDVMDAIQAEIVRRYVTGKADPTSVLG